jgi:hypothetical protein
MNVALLFNSYHPSLGSWYGGKVQHLILATGVLQGSVRQVRVSVGDIDTGAGGGRLDSLEVARFDGLTLTPQTYDRLRRNHLGTALGRPGAVFAWLLQNVAGEVIDSLDAALDQAPSYLGAIGIDFSYPPHLYFIRNSLVERYRLVGTSCSIFYNMGSNEDPDRAGREIFERYGFEVSYEDTGARRTTLDRYDTLEHFKRVADFQRVFLQFEGINEEVASNVILALEELHPGLFDMLAAAARTIRDAETPEDIAQAALSGRRFLEAAADYLFPPRDEPYNGRAVTKAHYRNRLWAYIEAAAVAEGAARPARVGELGRMVDKLVDQFNTGLHGRIRPDRVELAFRDLIILVANLVELDPAGIRRPYEAYKDELLSYVRRVQGESDDGPGGAGTE